MYNEWKISLSDFIAEVENIVKGDTLCIAEYEYVDNDYCNGEYGRYLVRYKNNGLECEFQLTSNASFDYYNTYMCYGLNNTPLGYIIEILTGERAL